VVVLCDNALYAQCVASCCYSLHFISGELMIVGVKIDGTF